MKMKWLPSVKVAGVGNEANKNVRSKTHASRAPQVLALGVRGSYTDGTCLRLVTSVAGPTSIYLCWL